MWDRTVLPATGRGKIPALTSAEACTILSDPGEMQGWVDHGTAAGVQPVPKAERRSGRRDKHARGRGDW